MIFLSELGHHLLFYHNFVRFTSFHSFNVLWILCLVNYGWGRCFQSIFSTWMNYSASCPQSPVILYHGIHNKHGQSASVKNVLHLVCVFFFDWRYMLNITVHRNAQFNFTVRKRTEHLSNEVEYISKRLFRFKMFLREIRLQLLKPTTSGFSRKCSKIFWN